MSSAGIRQGLKTILDRVRTSPMTEFLMNALAGTRIKELAISAYWSVYTLTPSAEQYEINDLIVEFRIGQRYEFTSLTHTFQKEREVLSDFVANIQEDDVIYDIG